MDNRVVAHLASLIRGRTLAECLDSNKDNILLLRLVAAAMVLLGHSYALFGISMVERDPARQLFGVIYTHFIGLMMFFIISGYLVTLSWQRQPSALRFLRARALRIFPALIVCVTLCALALGPLLTTLPISKYLNSVAPYNYIFGNASLLDMKWQLPGLFTLNPMTDYVNGSLWTLPVEASLYLVVASLGAIGLLRGRVLANLAIISLTTIYMIWRPQPLEPLDLQRVIICFFCFGMLCCINRNRIPISTIILLTLIGVCYVLSNTVLYRALFALVIAYSCLWLAYVPRLPSLDRIGDGSYGLYLWGFPVQQTLIVTLGISTPLMLFCLSLPISLLFGLASWHYIEKLALRLK